MARVVQNDKGFKVIALSHAEGRCMDWGLYHVDETLHHGKTIFLCMHCNKPIEGELYYIAALNDLMDKECYDKWCKDAIHYSDDKPIEDNNFNRVWREIQAWHRVYDVESIFG